ncbi:hypothetical protein [Nocardia sp. NPDC051463]|uniref:hypothetical protein n=1 Tax=Nocardia sp. NPDC051463 TaxID=3154845 RepID=UPI00345034DF
MIGGTVAASTGLALGALPLRDYGPATADSPPAPPAPHPAHHPTTGTHGGGVNGW